jgi:hypothetical protein
MGTRFVWLIPAFCKMQTGQQELAFDLTDYVRIFLQNKVWERKYEYGYRGGLKSIKSTDIEKSMLTFFDCSNSGIPKGQVFDMLDKYFTQKSHWWTFIDVEASSLANCKGLALQEIEFTFNTENIPEPDQSYDENFLLRYHACNAVAVEVQAFFRTAWYLNFICKYLMTPGLFNESSLGGISEISSLGKARMDINRTSGFAYPVIVTPSELDKFLELLQKVSKIWHMSLWPLFRYTKIFESQHVEMESFLDLLFALEGLFDHSTSTDFIKLACSLIVADSPIEARKITGTLSTAYNMRNEIVHAGRFFNGLEEISLRGKKVLSQEVFVELRKIVVKMLCFCMDKLLTNSNMRNLRVNSDDLINQYWG